MGPFALRGARQSARALSPRDLKYSLARDYFEMGRGSPDSLRFHMHETVQQETTQLARLLTSPSKQSS